MVRLLNKKKKDFNEIPKPISKQKPGDLLSQGNVRKLPDLPGNACDVDIPDITNLDILRTKGRTQGEIITYSAEQVYNYGSQSQRYDRSINLIPAYVNEDSEKIVYGFCSHDAPKGFWEVTVAKGGVATFIDISPNIITILCPRPFRLDELVTINTDSVSFLHHQIAGNRTVLILPNNEKYPLYDIQATCQPDTGCETGSISPLIIRVETDNPLLFDDLVILNRPIDNFDGQGYVGIVDTTIQGRKVNTFYRVPDDLQRVYLWQGTPSIITWTTPTQDSEFITQYRVQINTPPYTDNQILTPTQNRKATLNANQRYRVATDFNIFGSTNTTFSDPTYFDYPITDNKFLFADDSTNCLGFSFINNAYTTVNFGVKLVDEIDANDIGLGFVFVNNTYATITFAVVVVSETDTNNLGIGYVYASNTYTKVDLGGIIIG